MRKHVSSIVFFLVFNLLTGNTLLYGDAPFRNFITRSGDKLMDGNKEFRFIGANMPGLILPYDWTLYLPERMTLPTPWEQEDGFKTLDQMNLRVVRLWNLPIRGPKEEAKPWHYVLSPGQFNDDAFKCADSLFALANRYGVRVIFDLTAEWGDYLGGIGTYAGHRGKKREEFWTDPQLKEDFKATIRYVLNRTNTVTGMQYRNDKAVLAWQFGNEMVNAPDAWLSEMAAYIKSIDANHLVAETRSSPGKPQVIDANIDLYTRHYYFSVEKWAPTTQKETAALKGQRPFFVGEFGPYINNKDLTHGNVVSKMREFLDFVCATPGVSGAMLWSMYFHHQNGGFYWHQIMTYPAVWSYHWPGFPSAGMQREIELMSVMRDAAFKIQDMPVSPVPVPDSPELLPVSDVPLLSWRGSAGASGYDVERASKSDGPWTKLAQNVSDADVAYRPIFSDTTAKSGQAYFYRIIARNTSGMSKPSNIVGPVTVKRVCLLDELQDFSRIQSKSDGLKLNNEYNALYAEYLFRAKGTTNDWVVYEVPAPIKSIKVVAFFAGNGGKDLALQCSPDKKAFKNLDHQKRERCFPSPPGGAARGQKRTMVEYESVPSPDQRYLKVLWNDQMELDLVEIQY
ncbi:MAG: hypothetical protein PHI84_18080 [Kiritimatiellae bacterium]|nr:hypothetical protein [Kiritimatiellia bacterium]